MTVSLQISPKWYSHPSRHKTTNSFNLTKKFTVKFSWSCNTSSITTKRLCSSSLTSILLRRCWCSLCKVWRRALLTYRQTVVDASTSLMNMCLHSYEARKLLCKSNNWYSAYRRSTIRTAMCSKSSLSQFFLHCFLKRTEIYGYSRRYCIAPWSYLISKRVRFSILCYHV